jgi:hypothetical protein
MDDVPDHETKQLVGAMQELIRESKRLVQRHQELRKEYERLHEELNRRRGYSSGDDPSSK